MDILQIHFSRKLIAWNNKNYFLKIELAGSNFEIALINPLIEKLLEIFLENFSLIISPTFANAKQKIFEKITELDHDIFKDSEKAIDILKQLDN